MHVVWWPVWIPLWTSPGHTSKPYVIVLHFYIIQHAHNYCITVTKLATVQAVQGCESQYSCRELHRIQPLAATAKNI